MPLAKTVSCRWVPSPYPADDYLDRRSLSLRSAHMGLRMKFNLVLLLAFVIGLALAAYLTDRILKQNAREEVV